MHILFWCLQGNKQSTVLLDVAYALIKCVMCVHWLVGHVEEMGQLQ